MKFSAYFPLLDFTEEVEIENKPIEAPETSELAKKIANAKRTARTVNANDILERLEQLETQLENEKGSADGKMKILDGLRKELLQLDKLEKAQEWPAIEQELKNAYFELEELVRKIKNIGVPDELNIDRIDAFLQDSKQKIEIIIRDKNKGEAKELTYDLIGFSIEIRNELTGGKVDVSRIQYHDREFNNLRWKDKAKARALINQGLRMIAAGQIQQLRPILHQIWDLRIDKEDTGTLG
jgi:molecular chaperone DnaK